LASLLAVAQLLESAPEEPQMVDTTHPAQPMQKTRQGKTPLQLLGSFLESKKDLT
jgi:hypothetical protein